MAANPLDDKAPTVFDRKSAGRIAAATRLVEETLVRRPGRGKLGGTITSLALAVADGAISARAGTTLGSGFVYFTRVDSFGTEETDRTPVKNLTDYQVADNSYLLVGLVDGEWIVLLTGSCDDLS